MTSLHMPDHVIGHVVRRPSRKARHLVGRRTPEAQLVGDPAAAWREYGEPVKLNTTSANSRPHRSHLKQLQGVLNVPCKDNKDYSASERTVMVNLV